MTEIGVCCKIDCGKNGLRTPCLHSACYALRFIPMTKDFFIITRYDFSPPVRVEHQRERRLEEAVARRLKANYFRHMPQEICLLVARYIAPELAAVACQELARDTHPWSSVVDFSQNVYARYKEVEGTAYLQSLYNSPPGSNGGGRLVYVAQHGFAIPRLYAKYDHLGVRDIRFGFPDNYTPPSYSKSGGVWWKELGRDSGLAQVVIQSDVSIAPLSFTG